ncbi:MAG: hypothetical protein WA322_01490 [Pseudolabrys sp.]
MNLKNSSVLRLAVICAIMNGVIVVAWAVISDLSAQAADVTNQSDPQLIYNTPPAPAINIDTVPLI